MGQTSLFRVSWAACAILSGMPRSPRADEAGGLYHALNRANLGAKVFLKEGDYRAFEKVLHEALQIYQVELYCYQIMVNHVHLLAAFVSEESMLTQYDSWMHFTAQRTNTQIGRKGKFWQQEPFDHLVRSPEQYVYLRKYIEENGPKAGLNENEYLYFCYVG